MVMSYRLYETCTFLAYLTVVPSMGYFLIKIETDFYENYRMFFRAISRKRAYTPINHLKNQMSRALSEGTRGVLIIQGTVTGLMLYLAPWFIEKLQFSPLALGLIRISMIGSLVMSLFMLMVIMILYLDQRKHTLLLSFLFLASNAVGTWLSLELGFCLLRLRLHLRLPALAAGRGLGAGTQHAQSGVFGVCQAKGLLIFARVRFGGIW